MISRHWSEGQRCASAATRVNLTSRAWSRTSTSPITFACTPPFVLLMSYGGRRSQVETLRNQNVILRRSTTTRGRGGPDHDDAPRWWALGVPSPCPADGGPPGDPVGEVRRTSERCRLGDSSGVMGDFAYRADISRAEGDNVRSRAATRFRR